MILTLQVIGDQAQALGAAGRKVFQRIGGTIGRLPDNDWVFPDRYVSGRHALIRYVDGKYFIEDTSTNGVRVNSPQNRLSRGQAHPLRDGDLLYIDAYEIKVCIAEDPAVDSRNDPLAALKARGSKPRSAKRDQVAVEPAEDRTAGLAMSPRDRDEHDEGEDEGTQWFGPAPGSAPPASFAKPRADSPAQPAQPARSVPPQQDARLQILLEAAGIEGLDPSSDMARTLGHVLRAAIGGLMEALRAREQMKDELRLRGTTFKAANNNPLKFSANVDDAFHNLLIKHNPAYLAPAEAVEDACRDVRDHQAALLAAMRLAFESMLGEFDPDRLEQTFEHHNKGSILGVPNKLRYWDLYREQYGKTARDGQAAFRTLFCEEFAKAYEQQLERLRAMHGRSN